MGIFNNANPGTNYHRSRFTTSISNRMDYDCQFHQLVPVLKRFVLPGDVWRIGGDVLVRFQPMLTPTLTPNNFRVRYFFVPLRLVEPDTELILTGSKDGHLYNGTLPMFDNFVDKADKVTAPNAYKLAKHSFWDYMNVPIGDYEPIKNDECLPAAYYFKAYLRIVWDYYDDENRGLLHSAYADFDAAVQTHMKYALDLGCSYSYLKKDYFTSSLPWQLKAISAPRIDVTGNASFTPNYSGLWAGNIAQGDEMTIKGSVTNGANPFNAENETTAHLSAFSNLINNKLNQTQNVNLTGIGFTADDLRTMMAQTRIFERLARTGSRYTEYLRANFGTAPADDTLQRAQYLGGWKVPIVTTEVLQTAADGANPVGTMRGHGITRGGQSINTFYAKEFGVLFGLAEVTPDVQYTQGIPRQLTYKRRFDFFNPSLQHLSEQEVRNGELFISFTDGLNDNTFGFQAYGNELRSYQNETVGDMRDSLSYWNQALQFANRPNLNSAFLNGNYHLGSFNRPFVVNGASAYPILVQFYNRLDVYRPMVRYSTPGLVDHL